MKILDVPQSGSVAGDTSSRNRYGQYRRTRAVPVQPRTPRQVAVRSQLSSASQAWGTELSDFTRSAWSAFASERGLLDSLGQTIYLTGAQTYVAWSVLYQQMGLVPPALPPIAAAPAAPNYLLARIEDGKLNISVAGVTPGDVLIVSASAPVSPGVSFGPRPTFMKIAHVTTESEDVDISTVYRVRFGDFREGQKIFVTVEAVRTAKGTYKSQPISGGFVLDSVEN